jgi:hypothetical protein
MNYIKRTCSDQAASRADILRPMSVLRVYARRCQQQPRQGLIDDVI